jgi:2,3-bisphosphoglycerate-independent phosphoglycerate mutase
VSAFSLRVIFVVKDRIAIESAKIIPNMANIYKKTALIIMDGWGLGVVPKSDAVQNANTQYVDYCKANYSNAELVTCGRAVGLPDGQMGNSEVGHLNLGAGRIVYQELEKINVAIRSGQMQQNSSLQASFAYCIAHQKPLHVMGLLSDGGVHSHIEHLKSLCSFANEAGLPAVYIHAFTDGRDTDPQSALQYVTDLEQHIADFSNIKIATITGRYYAMDRDKRWERIAIAYNAIVRGQGEASTDCLASIRARYAAGETDEFIKPIIVQQQAVLKPEDAVLCFNFRTDRCREITQVLSQQDMPEYGMMKLPLHFTTFTEYDKTYQNVHVLFYQQDLTKTLGEVIADAGLTQARMAETEKYPHVSFFFSGGREEPFVGENRVMVPSPKDVATYDQKPQMSAIELTDSALKVLKNEEPNFLCLNFANADMVGHTGVWEAAIAAVQTVDECVQKLVKQALELDYAVVLTADHGNSDYMINEDGSPNTAHTLNPVPVFIIANEFDEPMHNGILADVAPTILKLMGLQQPMEMTGAALF